jgi:hypothetical protein
MRRWLAILLLTLLPFQFTWAVASSYCGHETGSTQSRHLGHHDHQHVDHHDGSPSSAEKLPGAADPDCLNCHGQIAALPNLALPATASEAATRLGSADSPLFAARAPDRPERPQWARFA